jgi:hypothetical protein
VIGLKRFCTEILGVTVLGYAPYKMAKKMELYLLGITD